MVKLTLPVATLAPVGVNVAETMKYASDGDWKNVGYIWTGVDANGKIQYSRLARTYLPMAMGFGISWAASHFGYNRKLARAGVPILRV